MTIASKFFEMHFLGDLKVDGCFHINDDIVYNYIKKHEQKHDIAHKRLTNFRTSIII